MDKHFIRALKTENNNNCNCQPNLFAKTNDVTLEFTMYSIFNYCTSLKGLKMNSFCTRPVCQSRYLLMVCRNRLTTSVLQRKT